MKRLATVLDVVRRRLRVHLHPTDRVLGQVSGGSVRPIMTMTGSAPGVGGALDCRGFAFLRHHRRLDRRGGAVRPGTSRLTC